MREGLRRLIAAACLCAPLFGSACAWQRQPPCSGTATPVNVNGIHPGEVERHDG